jgi:hypothetical protein
VKSNLSFKFSIIIIVVFTALMSFSVIHIRIKRKGEEVYAYHEYVTEEDVSTYFGFSQFSYVNYNRYIICIYIVFI